MPGHYHRNDTQGPYGAPQLNTLLSYDKGKLIITRMA